MAIFGPLNALELKLLLYPQTKTHENEGKKYRYFINDKNVDRILKELENPQNPQKVLEFGSFGSREIITSVEPNYINYGERQIGGRRYKLDLEKAVKQVVDQNCNYPDEIKKIIIEAIMTLWENHDMYGLKSENETKWPTECEYLRFDDLIFELIAEALLTRIHAELIQTTDVRFVNLQVQNWEKLNDDQFFYLASFRWEHSPDRVYEIFQTILSKNRKKAYQLIDGIPTIMPFTSMEEL